MASNTTVTRVINQSGNPLPQQKAIAHIDISVHYFAGLGSENFGLQEETLRRILCEEDTPDYRS